MLDGAWLGTDVWYELRRARSTIKQEPPPEPRLPVRTQFSQVRASGPVKNGVFTNNDLLAELPFMQVTGKGTVNLVEATLDYRMSAKVISKPEFVGDDITADELKDFTKMVVPMRVSGPLTSPNIKVDVGKMLQAQAKREVEEKIKKELEEKVEEELEDTVKDKVKDKLKDVFKF
jgi:AsmA protein